MPSQRGIVDFRNKVVGHIWDKALKRPLTNEELDRRVEQIVQTDVSAFMRWVNDPDRNTFPVTVVSIVERVRDELKDTHGFTNHDLRR